MYGKLLSQHLFNIIFKASKAEKILYNNSTRKGDVKK